MDKPTREQVMSMDNEHYLREAFGSPITEGSCVVMNGDLVQPLGGGQS